MKTPEDEAFDDLARKQGAWGGGFPAKRAMAANKLQEDLTNYGTAWSQDGERIDPTSVYKGPAQEPEREALKLALEVMQINLTLLEKVDPYEDQEDLLSDSLDVTHKAIASIKEALAQPEQPAQEPTDIAALVEGMEVSVDVSTGEHDSGSRLFGTVTLAQQNQGSKHGLILLVQDPEPNFKPALSAQGPHEYDWSMLEAAKESLREHMARIKELEAALAQQAQEPVACARCKDLEEQAYDLLGQLKAANLKWSVAHPQPVQEPAAMDNHQTLEALKYAASKGYGRIARRNSAPFTIKEASAQPAQEPDWKTMPPKDAPLVQWVKEQTTPPLPAQQVQFLAGGTRFKLSLDDDGKVNCFGHWKELDGRWVALVAAEDDCHLKLTAPLPAQETVAWALEWTFDGEEKSRRLYDDERHCKLDAENDGGICRPLVYGYTAPTPREWVGLTAEEIASIPLNEHTLQTAERLLKEKNT